MQPKRIGLLTLDDFTQSGIEGLVKTNGLNQYQVKAYRDFESVLREIRQTDLLLIDASGLRLRMLEGYLKRIAACCESVNIMVISSQLKGSHIKRVLEFGAKGFMYRDDISFTLMHSLDLVSRGAVTVSSSALAVFLKSDHLYSSEEIPELEKQILQLTARGRTVKQIATELGVSTRTVYRARDSLRVILDAPTTETLVIAAYEHGLLELGDE